MIPAVEILHVATWDKLGYRFGLSLREGDYTGMESRTSWSWVEAFIVFSLILKRLCESSMLTRELIEKSIRESVLVTNKSSLMKQVEKLREGKSISFSELLSTISCSLENALLEENKKLLEFIQGMSEESECKRILFHIRDLLLEK